ncbi:MAG: dihydroorotase [Rhodospirillaceae bacterium]|nr:dihydroorotase [Rhodospirillaceae bacterium]MBT3885052.1 dihydroorotase [Rhodospirillaceae bacterium]MBT4116243.1 dihydroorotase [Rhodospirillaceae bacterium]MBT4673907.1 dihydroorotase [Rhodospirillaceae bacterium]MBT4718788.1 dihydroorotase [Rhodospirillaceae bacterium]
MPDDPLTRTAYVNARLLDPASGLDASGGIITNGESIVDAGPGIDGTGLPKKTEIIDCGGLCLAPGLVDIRVQIREPGEEHKGTIESAGMSATAGGVTTMVCLPNTMPVIQDMSGVEFVARRARKIGLSKIYPYAAATKDLEGAELTEMGLLAEAGAVAFTDGDKVIKDAQVMRRALTYAKTFGLIVIQRPEEPSLARGGVMNSGEMATRLGLTGIPAVAEIIMVERDLRLVEMTGGRLHFSNISTGEAVRAIGAAKARGFDITCDTAPPYFALNEASVGEYRTFAKLSPPLRSEADRLAVVQGLADGTIDCIASDHAPHDEDSKRLPFGEAAFGGVGLETLLPVSLELYHNGHMKLLDLIAKLTSGPADVMRLGAGQLAKGAPADLSLFDPDQGWQVDADELASKAKNSPFDGRPVQGVVRRTVIDGRTVFVRGA